MLINNKEYTRDELLNQILSIEIDLYNNTSNIYNNSIIGICTKNIEKDNCKIKNNYLYKLYKLKSSNSYDNVSEMEYSYLGNGFNSGRVVYKLGSDVDSNGNLNLLYDSFPDNYIVPTVYINNVLGDYQIQFDKNTKVISGLIGINPTDKIQIIF